MMFVWFHNTLPAELTVGGTLSGATVTVAVVLLVLELPGMKTVTRYVAPLSPWVSVGVV